MSTQILDVETVPLPIGELTEAIPAFDADAVKYGNAKDPEKRANILAEAERKHTQNFIDNAALDPRTGRIKVAGFRDVESGTTILLAHTRQAFPNFAENVTVECTPNYQSFLGMITMRVMAACAHSTREGYPANGRLLGYCIHEFDLPFLFQACWMNGIPANVRHYRRGRYWNDNIVDIRETWTFGDRFAATGGLDGLSALVGTKTRKNGTGKDFAATWERDPKEALEYTINDLLVTEETARALGEL